MRLALYALMLMLSIYAVSGINFNVFIKKNQKWPAVFLQVLLAMTLAYCTTHLLLDFLEFTQI